MLKPINELAHNGFTLLKETEAERKRLNDRIQKHNAELQIHLDNVHSLSASETSQLGAGVDLAKRKGLDLLAGERVIRESIDQYWGNVETSRLAAENDAHKAHEEVQAKVRANLVRIGYVDGMIPGTESGGTGGVQSITPGMIWTHPEVFAAKGEAHSLRARDIQPQRNSNLDRIAKLDEAIENARRKLLASLAGGY